VEPLAGTHHLVTVTGVYAPTTTDVVVTPVRAGTS